ncbi:MAG: hypothetical protein IJS32_01505, partial [Kiritimatiellae bacterium]|nr:hypothetical protein [Kiritimatiellia bacterium]
MRDDPALAPFRGLLDALGKGEPETWNGGDPLAGAEDLVAALRALPALAVPAGFADGVVRAIHAKRHFCLTRFLARH